METLKKLGLTIVLLLFLGNTTQGQDIITATNLAKVIKDNNTVIVSTRKAEDYKKIHITGAVHLDHKSLYQDMSMLKNSNELAIIIGKKGIAKNMNIIIYDGGSGKYSGRVYWILKYLGAPNVKILDGGMRAWRMARKPVTKNPSNVKPVQFIPKVDSSVFASMDLIKKAKNNPAYVIVDVRSPDEFTGLNTSKLRPGHIPSAINFNFTQVLSSKGTLKSVPDLFTLFTKVGITNDKEIILYCESGVRAGIVFMALKSGLKYPKVRVYDGAYIEWQSVDTNKVQVGI